MHRLSILRNILNPYFKHCCYGSSNAVESKPISKYVLISDNKDICINLALEDWLYERWDLSDKQLLLLWRNYPAIVIGRHQNPWKEANVLEKDNVIIIPIIRRNSGGGTVYHDLDNLNLSFLTSKDHFNRTYNLELISKSILKEWNIKCEINSRNDLVIGNYKISGTAAKVNKKAAYHHCTLLVDVNRFIMTSSLHSKKMNIITNATASIPSPTINLRELNPYANVERLMTVIGNEFLESATQQMNKINSMGFYYVTPNEKNFPGITEKSKHFRSWQWIYGKTPKFKICDQINDLNLEVSVENGIISNIDISSRSGQTNIGISQKLINEFKELRFSKSVYENIKNSCIISGL